MPLLCAAYKRRCCFGSPACTRRRVQVALAGDLSEARRLERQVALEESTAMTSALGAGSMPGPWPRAPDT